MSESSEHLNVEDRDRRRRNQRAAATRGITRGRSHPPAAGSTRAVQFAPHAELLDVRSLRSVNPTQEVNFNNRGRSRHNITPYQNLNIQSSPSEPDLSSQSNSNSQAEGIENSRKEQSNPSKG